MTSVSKTCNVCGEDKPLEAYSATMDRCRNCHNRIRRERRAADSIEPRRFAGMYPISKKACRKCKEVKALNCFSFRARSKDGFDPYCRPCLAENNASAHARHLSERKASAALRRERDDVREAARAAAVNWRIQNLDRAKANAAAWRKSNPMARKALEMARRARKEQTQVAKITADQLIARMTYFGNRCWMCLGDFEAIDHVKPLVKMGPHILANLRPVCRSCNSRKHAKWYGPSNLNRFLKS